MIHEDTALYKTADSATRYIDQQLLALGAKRGALVVARIMMHDADGFMRAAYAIVHKDGNISFAGGEAPRYYVANDTAGTVSVTRADGRYRIEVRRVAAECAA